MNNQALFIIDAQNDYCSSGGSLLCHNATQVVHNICNLLKRKVFDEVTCTLDTHYCDYLSTMEGRQLPVKHCIKNTSGHEMNKDVYDALYHQNWYNLEKNSFMINVGNDTEKLLENPDCMTDIFICGFATDLCVLNNALLLKHLFWDFKIYLIEDCCAGTSQHMHDLAIELLKQNQISVINSSDIL